MFTQREMILREKRYVSNTRKDQQRRLATPSILLRSYRSTTKLDILFGGSSGSRIRTHTIQLKQGYILPVLDLFSHGQEGLLDIRRVLCTSLEEWNSQGICKLFGRIVIHNLSHKTKWCVGTFLLSKSLLFPTSNLLTPSFAYRSISCNHCLTLLNVSWSVTSYTTMIPCAPR